MSLAMRAIGILAAVVAVILYLTWGTVIRWTADEVTPPVALWLSAGDAAPGDQLAARVRIDTGLRVRITRITVTGAVGVETSQLGEREPWGSELADRLDEATDEHAFAIQIPDDAATGEALPVTISVAFVAAERAWNGFEDRRARVDFQRVIPVYSKPASLLRRAGRAALAIAMWLAVVFGALRIVRRFAERGAATSSGWVLLIAPFAVLGYVAFVPLLAQATRLSGWGFGAACMAAWMAAILVIERRARRFGNRRYVVAQTQVAGPTAEAYRSSGAAIATRTPRELELCWAATGLQTRCDADELVIRAPGRPEAIVPIPSTGAFGGGQPFEIQCRDRDLVIDLVTMATSELGDLTWSEAGRGGAFSVRAHGLAG
jgi:hypothetical protein